MKIKFTGDAEEVKLAEHYLEIFLGDSTPEQQYAASILLHMLLKDVEFNTIEFSIASLQNGKKIAYAKKLYGYDAKLTKKIQAAEAMSKQSQLNQQPVSDNSISQNSEKSSGEANFSLSKAVEESGNLIAMHNVNADKLMSALRLGGLPSPSVAITKADITHDNYGDITMILPKESIDPQADSRNKVYGSDAWTPTSSNARTEYEVNYENMRAFEKKLAELSRQVAGGAFVRGSMVRALGIDDVSDQDAKRISERLASYDEVRAAYLGAMGKNVEPEYKAKEYSKFGNAALQKYIDRVGVQHLASVVADSYTGDMTAIRAEEEAVRQIIRDDYAEKRAYALNRRPELKEERINKYMENNVSIFTIEDFIKGAWQFYEEGGAVTEEIDRLATSGKLREAVSTSDVIAWLEPQVAEFLGEPGIYNGKDIFTPSGRRRSFSDTHWSYTAENIVKAMQLVSARGETWGGTNANTLIATATPSYKTIDEMHADEGRLRLEDKEAYEAILNELDEALTSVEHDIIRTTKHHSDNTYDEEQIIGGIIAEAATGARTVAAVRRAFSKEGYSISEVQAGRILALYDKASSVPTGYFEAKPERVIGFDEVAVVIIPNNTDPKLKQELLNHGLAIAEYDPDVEGSRQKVVNNFEQYKFSLSRLDEPDANTDTRLYPLEDVLPVREDVTRVQDSVQDGVQDARNIAEDEDVMPMPEAEQRIDLKYLMEEDDTLPVREDVQAANASEAAEDVPSTTVRKRLETKKGNYERELESNRANRKQAWDNYDDAIAQAQSEYDGLKNKDTKKANKLLRRIDRLKRQQANVDADYEKRISDLEARIGKTDAELLKDHSKKDRLERAYARIDRELEAKKAELAESYERKRAELESQVSDRSAFISSEAGLLYDELANLRRGVRASKDLGYLLDLGYDWKSLKAALAHARAFPDRVVNTTSEVEAVVRESLLRSYEARTEELADLENEQSRAEAQLDMEAEIERDSARKAEDILRRTEVHENYVNEMKAEFSAQGYDLDTVLRRAKNLSTFATVDNTPQRVMQKSLGYKEGDILADITVNRVAQNETEAIKWLNSFTDRKNGVIAKLSKKYNIKPGSKQSMAAQMYAEGYYVNEQGEYITYGDHELATDFPNVKVQENIKGLARDPIIRRIYDETLDAINESRVRNAYPEIQRLNNYFLHFQAMDDAFSRLGIPFNPNDIKAKDLPTDINGMTADLKPGQPYFASARHRLGIRTTFDLLGGLEKYLTSAKNQIYHIDDIQRLRALRNYIADDYGQAKGLESLDALTEEEAEEKIKQVFGSHLSTFAKFLNEEANILAGKTALIDRGLEGIIGRRGLTFIGDVNKQVGANQVGFNLGSSLTNFLAPVQAFAKMNKFDFMKGFTQTVANRLGSIIGKGDGFENSVMVRREGAHRFHRTAWQKMSDPGYALMGAVDSISTEIIARAKYNELTRKNKDMTPEQAHFETDKWVSALMADRSLGQMPQIYNSRMLGLITKYQLEVRNQLDSMVYDTIQETKLSNEEINNKLIRNAKTAAKVASTWFTLAVAQNLFGKVFESIAGYNPAFDIIEAISAAMGWDDDDDSEDTVLDNIEEGFLTLLEDLPYSSLILDGGRIPISGALPIGQLVTGENGYGQEVSRLDTVKEALPYYVLPAGYGQLKKSISGLSMFDELPLVGNLFSGEDLPVSGSYTSTDYYKLDPELIDEYDTLSGIDKEDLTDEQKARLDEIAPTVEDAKAKTKLRYPVEDSWQNVLQALLFGKWANENAQDYFDNDRSGLNVKQTQEYLDSDMTIQEYWDYRDGLKGLSTLEEQADYINSLDIPLWKKNLFINDIAERKEPIDMADYDKYNSFEEFDYAEKYPEKYAFLEKVGIGYEGYKALDEATKASWSWAFKHQKEYQHYKKNGIMPEDYSVYQVSMLDFDDKSNEAYQWEFNYPEKSALAKAAAGGSVKYREYAKALSGIKSDKDADGKVISGSRKEKVFDYIFGLDLEYGQKAILFKSEYPSDDTFNDYIVDYLNGRDDITYSEMKTILEELGATVYGKSIKW